MGQEPIANDSSKKRKLIGHETNRPQDGGFVKPGPEVSEADNEEYRNLLQLALEAYQEEYKEISDNWRNTETKAQGSVAMAGIFMAGIFAYTRELEKNGSRVEKWFIAGTVCLLVLGVIFAILALYVRQIAAPPLGENVDKRIRDLLAVSIPDHEISSRLRNLKRDLTEQWRNVNEESTRINQLKNKWLLRAQLSLMVAILLVGALTILVLFN